MHWKKRENDPIGGYEGIYWGASTLFQRARKLQGVQWAQRFAHCIGFQQLLCFDWSLAKKEERGEIARIVR